MGKFLLVASILLLAGCATNPSSSSHQHVTADGSHWAMQISMHTGEFGRPAQTAMIIYNKWSKTPIVTVEGQTKVLSEKLFDALVGIATSAGPAAITGNYILEAARSDCPSGTLCGTLVQVQNVAGASAGSSAEAKTN